MINARFDLDGSCEATAKDEKYAGIADAVNSSNQFEKFKDKWDYEAYSFKRHHFSLNLGYHF